MAKDMMHGCCLVPPVRSMKMWWRTARNISVGVCLWGGAIATTTHPMGSQVTGAVHPKLAFATTAKQMLQRRPEVLERAVHAQINRHRASKNLPLLQWNTQLAAQARQHSRAMAQGQTSFGHNGFSQRVQATRILYLSAAENVGYNQGYQQPVNVVVQGWLNSVGHRRNLEGSYNLTGVGVASNDQGEVYFTQIFLRSR